MVSSFNSFGTASAVLAEDNFVDENPLDSNSLVILGQYEYDMMYAQWNVSDNTPIVGLSIGGTGNETFTAGAISGNDVYAIGYSNTIDTGYVMATTFDDLIFCRIGLDTNTVEIFYHYDTAG